ncbi:MAG: transposase, partial [Chlamydiia bacterium]|nr:transposase [Chlamydiia bacterium]
WSGVIRNHILSELPIGEIIKHYSKNMGRPSKELVTVTGACVLQQIFNLTDEETVEQLAFNEQWHYALDSFNPEDQVVSLKTLWSVRYLLVMNKTANKLFADVTDKLAAVYEVDTRLQRLDSVHIYSNMAKLGRVRLLSRAIRILLKNLKRHHKNLYEESSLSELKKKYEKEESGSYFGDVKPSESKNRLIEIANDMYLLITLFKESKAVLSMYSYQMMQRVFSEHCKIEAGKVIVKKDKEVSSDSIQNLSDIDAGYDGHKGQGYQVQLMETYSRKDEDENELNLITHVNVESADKHDSRAIKPALNDLQERKMLPEEYSADTSYGSESNRELSKEYGTELISPVPGKKPEKDMSGFEFNETTYEIVKCPQGHQPIDIKHNSKSQTAIFSKEECALCPHKSSCVIEEGKKGNLINYREKEAKVIINRQYEQSEEFKDKYRYRSGIEATNSRYIHMTGARRLRYRGLLRVDYSATLKALGINILRTAKLLKNRRISTSDLIENELELAM